MLRALVVSRLIGWFATIMGIRSSMFNPFTRECHVKTLIIFPWKHLWRRKVPPKVAIFNWTASLGKILTIDNLRKCGQFALDWCYMCKKSCESGYHLLLHCEVARVQWDEILSRTGLA